VDNAHILWNLEAPGPERGIEGQPVFVSNSGIQADRNRMNKTRSPALKAMNSRCADLSIPNIILFARVELFALKKEYHKYKRTGR
jgi:hypothetical protein